MEQKEKQELNQKQMQLVYNSFVSVFAVLLNAALE